MPSDGPEFLHHEPKGVVFMHKLVFAAVLVAFAVPAVAEGCGWGKNLTVQAPQTPPGPVVEAPQTPIPTPPKS
jgi:hypothetical protein